MNSTSSITIENVMFVQIHKGKHKGEGYYYAKDSDYRRAITEGDGVVVNIFHLLTGESYYVDPTTLRRITWNEIPNSVRADAFSMNSEIRFMSGNKSEGTGVYHRGKLVEQQQYRFGAIKFSLNKMKI